jgi:hypothetical protein
MANLTGRFKDSFLTGFDEAAAGPRELIRKLQRQRERDNDQIVRALEIAGQEIAMLKAAKAAPAGSSGLTSKELEALILKQRRAAGVPDSCL